VVFFYQTDERNRSSSNRKTFLRYLFNQLISPLNSLSLGFEMFDESNSNLDRNQMESLSIMRGAYEVISETFNEVLDLHRLEQGKLQLSMQPFHLVTAVKNALSVARGAALAYEVPIHQHFGQLLGQQLGQHQLLEEQFDQSHLERVVVVGDGPRLEHVMVSLLGRAVKHSPKGGVVSLGLSCCDPEEEGPEKEPVQFSYFIYLYFQLRYFYQSFDRFVDKGGEGLEGPATAAGARRILAQS
jgi:signal transduction histidine kinase